MRNGLFELMRDDAFQMMANINRGFKCDDTLCAEIYFNLGLYEKNKKTAKNLENALDFINNSYQMRIRLFGKEHPEVTKCKVLIDEIVAEKHSDKTDKK